VSCVAEGEARRSFRVEGGAEGTIRTEVKKVEGMRVSALLEREATEQGREGGR